MAQEHAGPARRLLEFLVIAVAYFALARGSLAFASINPSASPIWPPTGFALAVILLRGYWLLPAILTGAYAANLLTGGGSLVAVAIAAGNTLEALVGAFVIGAWARGTEAFQSPTGVAKFGFTVALTSTPISATIGVTALSVSGAAPWQDFASIWATWWMGDLAGAVTVCPGIVLWARGMPRVSLPRYGESVLLHLFSGVVGAVALGPLFPAAPSAKVLAFLAVLPLLWAALRRGPRDTSTVALILSAFAVWGVKTGHGPFVQPTLNDSFLMLVAFVTSVTLPSLALSTAVAAREYLLQRREEDYRRLIDGVRDYAIFMLDKDGHVITWNSGAARIKGYDEAEIVGWHFSRFYTDEDRRAGEPERVLALAKNTGRYESEGWRVRKDGSRFWAEVVVSAVHDSRQELVGFAKVTRDATARRAAEAVIEKTRQQLDQAQRLEALGRLAGNVAHDFRNLLSSISSGLQLIARDVQTLDKVAPEIRHAVERGVELTEQLLSFARPAKPQAQLVDFAVVMRGMRGILERTLGPDVILKISVQPGLFPIMVAPTQLEMVILNLVINARDAIDGSGLVEITGSNVTRDDGRDWVSISVADNGSGMTAEVLSQALEPFFTTKEVGRGTGLGLSQVRSFAEETGGHVDLRSELGKGTTVSISIPRAQS